MAGSNSDSEGKGHAREGGGGKAGRSSRGVRVKGGEQYSARMEVLCAMAQMASLEGEGEAFEDCQRRRARRATVRR